MNGNGRASDEAALDTANVTADDSTPRTFVNGDDFLRRLAEFCSDPSELGLNGLQTTLDQYQEASHLLEPYLASLSEPALKALKSHLLDDPARPSTSDGRNGSQSQAIAYFARYLYWLSKVVGDKILVTYFPHHPEDLDLLLKLITLDTFAAEETPWEYRYILILWLSLVVSIPFALNKFGIGTQDILEDKIIKIWLQVPGKERDAATLLASKYYTRRDVQETSRLQGFLDWARSCLQGEEAYHADGGEVDIFLATGILQTLCRITRSTTRQTFETQAGRSLLGELYSFSALYDPNLAHAVAGQGKSPLLRQLRAKFEGRLAGAYLPVPRQQARGARSGLLGRAANDLPLDLTNDDFDVPGEVEALISDLLELLPDSDSRVRWSASKALARISSSLPPSYVDQIVFTIVDMYSANVVTGAGAQSAPGSKAKLVEDDPPVDLSLVSSATWNGCNLCLASFLRSSLLTAAQISATLPWILRSLIFAQRKGTQKIGTDVRDSACYFIWALARAYSGVSEALINQTAIEEIARLLVVVACTDEEVSVRRAASAAFQEWVGRLSSVPDGLDVLLLLDPYIVGSRRQAFQLAAPTIATRYLFYSPDMIYNLATRNLFHADAVIRELAADSLGRILREDKEGMSNILDEKIGTMAQLREQAKVHGTLLLLAEIAESSQDASLQAKIFESLAMIPSAALTGTSIPLLLPVVARIITASLSPINAVNESAVDHTKMWRRFVELAAKRPEASAHDAAARMYQAASARFDCLNDLKNCLRTLKNATSFISQQYVTRVLGFFDFSPSSSCHALLDITVDRLSKVLNPKNVPTYKTIEAKRNALDSLGRICRLYMTDPKTDRSTILRALFSGINDYTIDERGDVGSWVRMICMERLTDILLEMQSIEGSVDGETLDRLIGLLLTGSAERLDNVREMAGRQIARLASIKGILTGGALSDWRRLSVVLPHLLSLLGGGSYTRPILSGLAISVGSPHNVRQPGADVFMHWASELPVNASEKAYDSARLLSDLVGLAKEPDQTNRRIVPILQTLALLLEDEVYRAALEHPAREELEAVGRLAIANARKSRVVSRLLASARLLLVFANSVSWLPEARSALLELHERGDDRMKEDLIGLETRHVEPFCPTRLFPLPNSVAGSVP